MWLFMGNSSSGIIEVASFNKYMINIGDRQKGRDAEKMYKMLNLIKMR